MLHAHTVFGATVVVALVGTVAVTADPIQSPQPSGDRVRIGSAVLNFDRTIGGMVHADERFAMCSTFKFLAVAAVLHRVDRGLQMASDCALCVARASLIRARCCLVPASRLAFFAFPQQRSSIGPMFTGFCQLLPSARRRHFPAPDGGSLLFAQFQGSGDLVENRDSPNQSMKPRP